MILNVIKTRVRCMFWDKSGDYLIIDQAVTGVKVAWTLNRPLYGTWEPVVLMSRCRSSERPS
jgi:hypothetical protein